jgi:Mrp family chromosome partitioning ATPase
VVTLQQAAIKAATKLIGKLKVQRAPSFGVIFEMASFKDKSPSGEFYNYAFEIVGPVEDRAIYEENFAQYRFFMEQGLKVKDLDGAQEDEASSAEEKF